MRSTIIDRQTDDLGDVIGMKLDERLNTLIETLIRHFNQEGRLLIFTEGAIPCVDALNLRDYIDASGVSPRDQRARDLSRVFRRRI